MHTANAPGTTLAQGWTVLALRKLAYVRTRPDLRHDRALRAFLLVRLAQSRYILGEYRKMRAPLARALATRPQVLLDRRSSSTSPARSLLVPSSTARDCAGASARRRSQCPIRGSAERMPHRHL